MMSPVQPSMSATPPHHPRVFRFPTDRVSLVPSRLQWLPLAYRTTPTSPQLIFPRRSERNGGRKTEGGRDRSGVHTRQEDMSASHKANPREKGETHPRPLCCSLKPGLGLTPLGAVIMDKAGIRERVGVDSGLGAGRKII